jgi:recombination protein RecT
MSETKTEVAKNQPTQSERFTLAVSKEIESISGESMKLTSFQKRLSQNYFIRIDSALKEYEKKRLAKPESSRDSLEYTWQNVNMNKLALDVVAHSSIGLDPAQPNHVNMIPYKNSTSNKFDFGFIIGYRGLELKAKKYGLEMPDHVVIEVVYDTDKFIEKKKSLSIPMESYEFEITNSFNRGKIVGGFYYLMFKGTPEKNKLRVFSLADLEKRKPKYASAEFWGGEKDKWEGGKKVGKEIIDGWHDEMVYKTIARSAYNSITIDSEKIDDHLMLIKQREMESDFGKESRDEKIENAKTEDITFTVVEPVVEEKPAIAESPEPPVETDENGQPKLKF